MIFGVIFCAAFLFCTDVLVAGTPTPSGLASVDEVAPFASEFARRGGKITLMGGSVPKSLNVLLDNNTFSAQVFGLMYESLLGMDPESGDYAPGLASAWEVSEDGREFTFTIDPDAKWSDGRPVTASDVVWSYKAIMNPENLTGPHKVSLATFAACPPEELPENRVRFRADGVHWRNLGAAGGFPVLPRHVFEGMDFNALNFSFPVVSGPYRIGELKENISLLMLRRDDWWAADKPRNMGCYNFDEVEFRFFGDRENAWEAFRKGIFDVFPVYTARIWAEELSGERFEKNWIVSKAVRNSKPVGFQGFAMNMRRFPYNDERVRRALAMLLDRKTMNETMMYGQYFLHRSYFEDLYDSTRVCTNEFFEYDPDGAAQLLRAAGWIPDPRTGMLSKDGRPLVVRFLSNDGGTADKFLAKYRLDLAAAGIGFEVDRKDWAAWARDMDSFNFDMAWCAWSAGLHKDPEGMWSSDQASSRGGNNITGFCDPEVDKLIEMQKTEFSLSARNDICRKIDAVITSKVPYILLWNALDVRMLWWNKFGVPDSIISKYGSADDAIVYWWSDPDAAAALNEAMRSGGVVPAPFETGASE